MGARVANLSTEWIIGIILVLALLRLLFWKTAWLPDWFPKETAKAIGELIESALIAVVLVFGIIRPFVVQAFYIPSESMEPTLQVGDRILVNKFIYRFRDPQRGDVVVFIAPPQADVEQKDFIKRVIALGGDTVEVFNHRVYVNGEQLKEPYIAQEPYLDMPPVVVPKGELFVMGDNRNNSNDSRSWGPLDRDRVVGKAMVTFWPPSRIDIIR